MLQSNITFARAEVSLPNLVEGTSVDFEFPIYSFQRDGTNISRGTLHIHLSTTPATLLYERQDYRTVKFGNATYGLHYFIYDWNTTIEISFVSSSSALSLNEEGQPSVNMSNVDYGISIVEPLGQFRIGSSGLQMFHYVENGAYYASPGYVSTSSMGYNRPSNIVPEQLTEGYWTRDEEIHFTNETSFSFNSINATELAQLKENLPDIIILTSNDSPFNAEGEALFLTTYVEGQVLIHTYDGFIGVIEFNIFQAMPILTPPSNIPETIFYLVRIRDKYDYFLDNYLFELENIQTLDKGMTEYHDEAQHIWFQSSRADDCWSSYIYVPSENKIALKRYNLPWEKLDEINWTEVSGNPAITVSVGEDLHYVLKDWEEKYGTLNGLYEDLILEHESTNNLLETMTMDLMTKTNYIYILLIATTVFIATTAYFAKKKPKEIHG